MRNILKRCLSLLRNILKRYLSLCNYDIGNPKGDSCLWLNIMDAICLIGYVAAVIYTTWSVGIINLTYVATAILSSRTLIKFWIKQKEIKKNYGEITITYNTIFAIYLFITVILIVSYFTAYYVSSNMGLWAKLSLIIYYIIFFIVEITEIIVRCFEAEPHIYKR